MREEDILAHQSRPQHFSTWVPSIRDWRYATGVFQHDDFENDPKERSAWDTMDYDYQTGSSIKYTLDASSTGTRGSKGRSRIDEVSRSTTPGSERSKDFDYSPRQGQAAVMLSNKSRLSQGSTWSSMVRYRLGEIPDKFQTTYHDAVGLTVHLRFTPQHAKLLKDLVNDTSPHPVRPQSFRRSRVSNILQTPARHGLGTPMSSCTSTTLSTPRSLNTIKSIREFLISSAHGLMKRKIRT